MNKKVLYPALVLLGGLAIALLVATNKPELNIEPVERMASVVRTITVQSRAEYLGIRSQGTVQPRSQSELIPEVSGRVTWISPSLVSGGAFAGGDVLLRIDQDDYATQVSRGEAALERSEIEHAHALDELERLASLNQRQLASEQQLDNARRTAQVAEANLNEPPLAWSRPDATWPGLN